MGMDDKQLARLSRREIRLPVLTKSGHHYEVIVKPSMMGICEGGTTPAECMELRQTEMESIMDDVKKGISQKGEG